MHTWDKDILQQFQFVSNYILKADHFYAEINIDDSISNPILQKAVFSENKSLSLALGNKKKHKVRKILLKAFGVDILPFDQILPMMIINQISLSMFNEDAQLAMDHELWRIAKSNDKTLFGLESIEDQARILQSIPWEHQLKQLIALSKNVKKYRQFIKTVIQQYKDQDILGLLNRTAISLGPYKHLMLKDRNLNMVNTITNDKDVSLFIAVGSAHLAGYHGILRLLKTHGYQVKPVTIA